MLLAFAKQIVAASPIEAELEALHEGLNLRLKERFNDIIVERWGSLTTINSLENNLNLSWKLMKIWKRIQRLLKLRTTWKVSFCGQESNQVADQLAKLRSPSIMIFKNSLPVHIQQIYDREE